MSEKLRVIDAHQHFWTLGDGAYSWLGSDPSPINQDFTVEDVRADAESAGVDGVVLVQADSTVADTDAMLAAAEEWDRVIGVVGWAPLEDLDKTTELMERYGSDPRIVGLRHLMHDEADPDWTVRPDVLAGLRVACGAGLTYDVVAVQPRHLEHVPTLARELPEMQIVIDHLAKPAIATGELEPWAGLMKDAAAYPNVTAKLSGLNTATAPDNCTADAVRPYFDEALSAFGAERLMFGSDWPVSVLAGGYEFWWSMVQDLIAPLSTDEQSAILAGTAERVYSLEGRA